MNEMVIRAATRDDVAQLVAIEREAWPAALAAGESQVRARIDAFPAGQLLAELGGRPVGVAWSQRIDTERLNIVPSRFDILTDAGRFTHSHNPNGEVYQLIGVAVASAGRNVRLGRRLVDAEIAQARSLPGVRRIVGFTRPIGFHNHPGLTIEEYAALVDSTGKPRDPTLAFHLMAGAKLVSLHPGFRPEDEEARGFGALIEYAHDAIDDSRLNGDTRRPAGPLRSA